MKDYSRKAYQSKKGYFDLMHGTPARAFWNSITEEAPVLSEYGARGEQISALDRRYLQYLKQSEAKKPYLSDDYEEMEYEWEGIPGLLEPPWHIDHPWMENPQPTEIGTLVDPLIFILQAFSLTDYCKGTTTTIEIRATEPIYDIQFLWPNLMDPLTTFDVVSPFGLNVLFIDLFVPTSESSLMRMRAYLRASDALPPPSTQGQGWTGFTIDEERDLTVCPVFTFSLEMADGNVADGTQSIVFSVRDSTGASITSLATYDSSISKWVLQIDDDPIDPNGYWVDYINNSISTTNAIRVKTLYPFKYKTADFTNNVNLIAPGDYTDDIHVIKWDSATTVEPALDTGIDACDTDFGTAWTTSTPITGGVSIRTTEDQRFYNNVKASADYTTEWDFDAFAPVPLYCKSYFLTPVGENCNDFGLPTASCPDPISTFYIDLGELCITYTGGVADNTLSVYVVTFTSISGVNVETKTETAPGTCSSAFLEYPNWGVTTFSEDQTSPSILGIDEGYDLVFEPELQIEDICCDTGNANPQYIERLADLSYTRYRFDIGAGRFRAPAFSIDILLT